MNFQMFKLDLEKAEETKIKLPTSAGSSKKLESSRKASIYKKLFLYNFKIIFSLKDAFTLKSIGTN